MNDDGICDDCSWRLPTAHYVDRQGHASRLCNRCLGRAVERRELEVKLDMMHSRLRAQQSQYRRLEQQKEGDCESLERDLEWYKVAYAAAMSRVAKLEKGATK